MQLWKKAVFAGLMLLLAPVPVFFVRKPLVVITDAAFTTLYGKKRALLRKVFLSLRLFRQIKSVPIVEGAGPDLVSLAAWNASKRPRAVFFPFRYQDGARRYAKDHPGIGTAVLADRKAPPSRDGTAFLPEDASPPIWLVSDKLFDSYRAGFYASAIALESDSGGLITAFHGDSMRAEEQEAFGRGVRDYRKGKAAFLGEISFTAQGSGKPSFQDVACAVVFEGNTAYNALMNENKPVPLVLFTWMDPALLPKAAFLVFDDSPWEILPAALDALEKGQDGAIPSGIRWREKNILKNSGLRGKKLNFNSGKADN